MGFTTPGTLINILMAQDGYKMPFDELDQKLLDAGVLGFGVDTEVLVSGMRRDGVVNFDQKTETVSLNQNYVDLISKPAEEPPYSR